jgi:hypothetical protein
VAGRPPSCGAAGLWISPESVAARRVLCDDAGTMSKSPAEPLVIAVALALGSTPGTGCSSNAAQSVSKADAGPTGRSGGSGGASGVSGSGGSGTGGAAGSAGTNAGGSSAAGGVGGNAGQAGAMEAGADACRPAQCAIDGCGVLEDACGGQIDCGPCAPDLVCGVDNHAGRCLGPAGMYEVVRTTCDGIFIPEDTATVVWELKDNGDLLLRLADRDGSCTRLQTGTWSVPSRGIINANVTHVACAPESCTYGSQNALCVTSIVNVSLTGSFQLTPSGATVVFAPGQPVSCQGGDQVHTLKRL